MYSLFYRVAQLTNCVDGVGDRSPSSTKCTTTLPQVTADSGALEIALRLVFGTVTAVAVVIIVIQGIKFVLSRGEPEKSAQARKGVIYAAVGLVIIFMADVIVAFILGRYF